MLKVCSSVVELRSYGPLKLFDVTDEVENVVKECRVGMGIARVDVVGATPALLLLEESRAEDVVRVLTKLVPLSGWRHGNAYAHLISTAVTTSLALAIEGGELVLPQGCRIFLLETRPVYNHRRLLNIEVVGR